MKKPFHYTTSFKLFQEMQKYVQGGVSSGTRLWTDVCPTALPCSIFVKKALGSHLWDVDGNQYIDYRLGFGPVILGHSFPAVHQAVHRADTKGLIYALDSEVELEVAKKIHNVVPCADKVRFANSGTESTMTALRIARGYTKKEKVLKFHGHYHGHHDYLLFSTQHCGFNVCKEVASEGIPQAIQDLLYVEAWNDFEGVEKTVKQHHREIAALILEPVMANATVIPPEPGFLKHVRELCDQYNIVLIFDEVKTGFRLGLGGAQKLFKVTPDLATFAKSLGNGYPIACVAGKEDIMSVVRRGGVFHGGTYAANPVSLTAANATLDFLMKRDVYGRIALHGRKLMKGIEQMMHDHHLDGVVQGYPGLFHFIFTCKDKVTTFKDLEECDFGLFVKVHAPLLQEGVMIDQDPEEPMYLSYSHSGGDVTKTLDAFDRVFAQAKA